MAPIKNTNRGFTGSSISKVTTTQSLVGLAATSTGTITTPGNGFIYHFFTSPGTFTVNSIGYADYFVVAGGGGGGTGPTSGFEGGGGGAGGVRMLYNVLSPTGTYTISVGAGGNGRGSGGAGGSAGSDSSVTGPPSFLSPFTAPNVLTASGGGLGGLGAVVGGAGGSGGGGAGPNPGGAGDTPSVPVLLGGPQGNPGAFGVGPTALCGGGGGGAGEPGRNASGSTGGNGGYGTSAFAGDPGIPPAYGTVNPTPLPGRWFAGGGGGGGNTASSGGVGGGGPGTTPAGAGSPGTINTGGGGGGTGPTNSAGNGGSGIIIIRFKQNPN